MTPKTRTIVGIYDTIENAERAVGAFIDSGFAPTDISVVKLNHEALDREKSIEVGSKGIAPGGVLGGTLGLLAGFGVLATGGAAVAPIVVAGVGGALGGLIGSLVNMGIKEEDATNYETQVRDGAVLIAVHCQDDRRSLRFTGRKSL